MRYEKLKPFDKKVGLRCPYCGRDEQESFDFSSGEDEEGNLYFYNYYVCDFCGRAYELRFKATDYYEY